jgi:serine/threonine-protein kinase HipA
MRRGIVLFNNIPAGVLSETETGYEFLYTREWIASPEAEPVSLTLPLSTLPYRSSTIFPFFDGLIPEGWLLTIAVDNWKLDPRDRMGLLLTVCRDCIGAVSIIPEGDSE